jgi:hypothetical protein
MGRLRVATNPATSMLLALSSWLGFRSAPSAPRPMLLRVGSALRAVDVSARWRLGGGREVTTSRRLYVSDGMCLLAWARDARTVEVEVKLPEGARSVVVDRARYVGEALDLVDA